MSKYPPGAPNDLPPDLVSLSRTLARVCTKPGIYNIQLTVPHYPNQSKTAVITKLETVRIIKMEKR